MIAVVRLPNINPIIKIDMVFFILLAATITAKRTRKAPKLEAKATPQLKPKLANMLMLRKEVPIISNATPKLAPELIPKTKGPANGFLNNVCMSKPLTDRPAPTKTAVMAFGTR